MSQFLTPSSIVHPAGVDLRECPGPGWYGWTKPVLDRLIAAIGLFVLFPLFLIIAVVIRLDSPGPVIFRQRRVGAGGREFTMLKFRTMAHNADDTPHRVAFERFFRALSLADAGTTTFKIECDARVTRVGAFLRKTSLDELPQLINVVTGSMSLVGPRPPIAYETKLYEPRHWRRLSVRPGITGSWQATARSQVSFEQMVALDLTYIDNQSILLDLQILLRTVFTVLTGKGAG